MKPRITKAPRKTSAKPAAVKAPTAKPKLILRPKTKTAAKPAVTPASTNSPLKQLPPESLAPPTAEPVPQSKPLIITIPPESPSPPTETPILTTSEDKKADGYAVVESEAIPPVTTEATASTDYIVVESEVADALTPAPSVPTVTIPPDHAIENVSSLQLGDVLIIAVKVQPTPAPEVEP